MNIGLVSFHRDPNYGTMLQAYALAQAIRQEGHSCAYINYYFLKKPLWHRFAKTVADALGLLDKGEFAFFDTREFRTIKKKFAAFHHTYIPVSKRKYYVQNIRRALDEFDRFVVGSDQTWSPFMNRSPYGINFLQFVDDGARKSAYAPSIGAGEMGPEYGRLLVERLQSFAHLSCRERDFCAYLSARLDREVSCVLDPTLLLTPADWNRLALSPDMPAGSYILAYILGEKACISRYAEMLGEKMGLPVCYIATRPCYLHRAHTLDAVGPQEFLGLVRDAACVVTDSFHGTLFSINYGVQFYSFAKRETEDGADTLNDNARIPAFLRELGLEHRFREDDDLSMELPTDFAAVQEKLDPMRTYSRLYLQRITGS